MRMESIRISRVDNVRYEERLNSRRKIVTGSLFVTVTTLIFKDSNGGTEIWIYHNQINTIEKQPPTAIGSSVQVHCKTFQVATFIIQRESECHLLYLSLLDLSKPLKVEELFAFSYSPHQHTHQVQSAAWEMFTMETEFQRIGLPNSSWVETKRNKDYELCDTYPSVLYVPASASPVIILGSARFRSRGRLPVLTYYNKTNGAAICRCSQPLAGFNARCIEDEDMFQAIAKSSPTEKIYVIDTRPLVNAMLNRAQGKGYEDTNFYTNIMFKFFSIENIHVMRASLAKLVETCDLKDPTMSGFLRGLESSGWLKHIRSVLKCSYFIANAVAKEVRLSRPICGYIKGDPREEAPTFTQFLDCVWQLLRQFPMAFQFNEEFLLSIHDQLFSCKFGNFIGNSQRERTSELGLRERTYSLWGYLQKHSREYLNPFYDSGHVLSLGLMRPATEAQSIKFWAGLYNRFEYEMHPRESLQQTATVVADHLQSLKDHVKCLARNLEKRGGIVTNEMEDPGVGEAALSLGNMAIIPCVVLDWQCQVTRCPICCHATRTGGANCWKCGQMFCGGCLSQTDKVPGYSRSLSVPVCSGCTRTAKLSI